MKTIIKLVIVGVGLIFLGACTKNFEDINTNPNQPVEVSTASLMTAAQKSLMDDMMDEWWSGRQSLLYAQYWTQRNYTSEDRYAIRQNTNNTYWRLLYTDIMDLVEVIRLNTDADTKVKAAVYGYNDNQIACAKILKAWAMQVMTDTYGDIPYSEAFKGNIDPAVSIPNPSYDTQESIYAALLADLKTAVDMINLDESGFTTGDIIYGGDMEKWQKFGNSLRLRIALRQSKVDNHAAANAILAEVGPEGLLTSNADNATFHYIGVTPNNAPIYDAFFTSGRNDFTMCKTFIDYLKGVNDTLNAKINPFNGLTDPRLQIFSRKRSGKYMGMPYGMTDAQSQAYKGKCPSFYGSGAYDPATAPVWLNSKWYPVYMDYAEVKFMLSELNGWDQTHYTEGVKASIEFWRDMSVSFEGWGIEQVNDFNAQVDEYMAALPAANMETVLTQKYIALYMQGYQAWAEYRRTGYPNLLKPGEVANISAGGDPILFNPLVDTKGQIPHRMTFPQQEYVVNEASTSAAATQIGGDYMWVRMWWDKE
jgi:hypothetical protein